MTIEELVKQVHRLEIKTKALSKHLFSGEYHSTFKGRGMSFSEVRSYQYGDDVRSMDWNVTARTNSPHIKVFEEERELTLMLAIDVSASSFFGSQPREKQNLMAEISAVLAFSALQNNDKVGLLLFSEEVEKYIPPKKGKAHVLYILRTILSFAASEKKTNLDSAFYFLTNVLKKSSICFVISDFFDENYEKNLSACSQKHDLIGIQITDELEENLPNVGLLAIKDKETQESIWVDTSFFEVRKKYNERFLHYQINFKNLFKKAGANPISLKTTDNYIKILTHFFKKI
jgi:uncharacterized protein (DUF58 family)